MVKAIYDMHRHLWPTELLEELRRRREPPRLDGWTLRLSDGEYDLEPHAYGLERCLAELDRDGIAVAVVSLPPTLGIDELPAAEAEPLRAAYHEGALAAAAAAAGRLRLLALDRPRDGFAGVCVAAPAFADLDALAPVLDELQRR